MLGGLLRARIKATEAALKDGRLDEAFRLAASPDLRSERRAQAVLRQACDQFFDRAESHFKAGRYAEALLDLDKAAVGANKPQRIDDLQAIVRAAVESEVKNQQSRKDRIEAAQQHVAAGSLRMAERILQRASCSDLGAHDLKARAEDRRQRAQEIFQEVKQYADAGHWTAAIERFKEARRLHAKDKQIPDWESKLLNKVMQSIQESLDAGRLNRAFEEMALLEGIAEDRPAKREILSLLETIAGASEALRSSNYEEARRKALSLEHLLPRARWIQKASAQLKQIDELATELHGGPLGLVSHHRPRRPAQHAANIVGKRPASPAHLDETRAVGPEPLSGASVLPKHLLVLVDDSGSFLVIRDQCASIGRAASKRPPDIPLLSDLAEHHADITRMGDDYFLAAHREVNVGGRRVSQKLLQNGDKIILGKKAKLTFRLPNRLSSSAVLDLSDSAKMPQDVRRVILYDRLLTVGRSPQSHITVKSADADLVLYERRGQLWIRRQTDHEDPGVALELGRPVDIAGVGLVIQPWTM